MMNLSLAFLSITIGVIFSILPHSYHFIILRFKKPPAIPPDKKSLYKEYINSQSWRKIKRKRLAKDGYRCKMFHVIPVKTDLQVHHKSYSNLGNEKLTDLITVCRHCHSKIHKRKSWSQILNLH